MKVYSGKRFAGRTEVLVSDQHQGFTKHLAHFVRHSPDGFEWGYGGSGPSDLARSILIDYFGGVGNPEATAKAEPLYQKFKFAFLASSSEEFALGETEIEEWISLHGAAD